MVHADMHIAKTNHVIGAADDVGSQIGRPLPDSSGPYMVGVCGRKPRRCVRGHKGERHCWRACFSRLVSAIYRLCVISPYAGVCHVQIRWRRRLKAERIDSILIANTLHQDNFEQNAARHAEGPGHLRAGLLLPEICRVPHRHVRAHLAEAAPGRLKGQARRCELFCRHQVQRVWYIRSR